MERPALRVAGLRLQAQPGPRAPRSSRNLFSLLGREGEEIPPRPVRRHGQQHSLASLWEGRTVQAAFTWEPAAVTALRSVFMKDKVCIFSTIRDVKEELFSPPLLVLGGKISWFGAAYKSVLAFTLLPPLARGSGCRPQHKLTLPSTTQHQMPFEQLAPSTRARRESTGVCDIPQSFRHPDASVLSNHFQPLGTSD